MMTEIKTRTQDEEEIRLRRAFWVAMRELGRALGTKTSVSLKQTPDGDKK